MQLPIEPAFEANPPTTSEFAPDVALRDPIAAIAPSARTTTRCNPLLVVLAHLPVEGTRSEDPLDLGARGSIRALRDLDARASAIERAIRREQPKEFKLGIRQRDAGKRVVEDRKGQLVLVQPPRQRCGLVDVPVPGARCPNHHPMVLGYPRVHREVEIRTIRSSGCRSRRTTQRIGCHSHPPVARFMVAVTSSSRMSSMPTHPRRVRISVSSSRQLHSTST